MSLTLIFTVLIVHWVADFVFQTHWQATNKSTSNFALYKHIRNYTVTWLVTFGLWVTYSNHILHMSAIDHGYGLEILWFFPITFVSHFVTDYFSSRMVSYYWKKDDIHNAFVVIGFDQILHYVQLFLTINWLLN